MIDREIYKEVEKIIVELDGLRQRLAIVESKLTEDHNPRFHLSSGDGYRNIQRWD